MTLRLSCAAILFLLPAAAATAQTIAAPARIVVGDPVPVRIDGLPPGAEVEISAARRMSAPLRAAARFRADSAGRIDLADAVPLSGDYSGRDPAGLFWSMRPDDSAVAVPPNRLRLTVSRDGHTLATHDVDLLATNPGLSVTHLEGFPGAALHRPAGTDRLPVVILLGGSEGGDSFGLGMVPFVTRLGFAALVLPYYAPPWIAEPAMKPLPAAFADIPVDRIEAVRGWIDAQPGLDADRIAIIGASKGGEFAMLAAAHLPWLRAVVGFVPSDVVWEGWGPGVAQDGSRASFSWRGEPLPFVPYSGMAEAIAAMARGERVSLTPVHARGRQEHPETVAAATIPVERFRGPMMVIGGGRDSVWPSAEMARAIATRRRAAALPTELLLYPEAGHALSGGGWSPLRAWDDGTAAATARAQAEIRPRLARFLREALSGR